MAGRRKPGGNTIGERVRQLELDALQEHPTVVRRLGIEVNWAKIANVMISSESVESSNFVAGTSGWKIDGNGNAEFNTVTVRGDIISGNWDGADPADLSTGIDSTATAGFYLDSSAGRAQFTDDVFFGISTDNYIHLRTITNIGYVRWAGTLGTPAVDSYWAGWLVGTSPSVVGNLLGTAYEFTPHDPGKVHMRSFEDKDGYVSIGTPDGQIDVGNHTTGAGASLITGVLTVPDGTAGAPTFSFDSDDDTGVYLAADGILAVSTVGTERFRFTNGHFSHNVTGGPALTAAAGTVALPAFTFTGDTDTGIYRIGANDLGIVAGGTEGIRINTTHLLTIPGATGEFAIRHADVGSISAPVYSFWNDLNMGMTRLGTDVLGFATAGTGRLTILANGRVQVDTPPTTGTAVNTTLVLESGRYSIFRKTSARKYKNRINYNVVDQLAGYELHPTKFYFPSDKQWFYDFIADDLAEQDPLFGTYDAEGDVESYQLGAVLAVMAAKLNKREAEIINLKDKLKKQQTETERLQSRMTLLEDRAA